MAFRKGLEIRSIYKNRINRDAHILFNIIYPMVSDYGILFITTDGKCNFLKYYSYNKWENMKEGVIVPVKLELIEKEDLRKVIEWNINKSADDLLQWAGPMYNHPLTLEQLENYFLNDVKKDNSNIYVYKIKLDYVDEAIGTVELRVTDKDNSIGRVCRFLIGDENNRGKGIGTNILREILRIGFEDMNLEKITLGVFDFNRNAIKCYENVGFIKEKFLENARKSSMGYWNLYEMAITKAKWQKENK